MPTITSAGPSNAWETPQEQPVGAVESAPEPEDAPAPSPADVRAWAKSVGLVVSDRGSIAASVVDRYREAHSG